MARWAYAMAGLLGAAFLLSWYVSYAAVNNLFPAPAFTRINSAFKNVAERFRLDPWYFDIQASGPALSFAEPDLAAPGLIRIVGIDGDRRHFIRVIERDGTVIQQWRPNWFELVAPGTQVPTGWTPDGPPGPVVHGTLITENGDVVFNLEKLGTFRMNACGELLWAQLDSGHHSLDLAADGTYWLTGAFARRGPSPDYRNITGRHIVDTIVQLSPDGEILSKYNLYDILADNGLAGLLYLSTTDNMTTQVKGDLLHTNDVEIFPATLAPGLFQPGDIMVSLRNINAIIVLDPDTLKIKFKSIGQVLRQHDPDFVDGNRITVYDNNNTYPARQPGDPGSRIVEIDARDGTLRSVFEGADRTRFFTNIMGKSQRLDNGNWMITSSREARAFEATPEGQLVWEIQNLIGNGRGAILTEASVMPAGQDAAFFENARNTCAG